MTFGQRDSRQLGFIKVRNCDIDDEAVYITEMKMRIPLSSLSPRNPECHNNGLAP
jgi:hypothetical protein